MFRPAWLRRPVAGILLIVVIAASVAPWVGPEIAAGVGAPLLRVAAGGDPSPLAGAIEAGLMGSAVWLVFEA